MILGSFMISGTPTSQPGAEVLLTFAGGHAHQQEQALLDTLAALPSEAHEQRCRLLARLAAAQALDPVAAQLTSRRAEAAANLAANPSALLWARFARCIAALTPETAEQRVADATLILGAELDRDDDSTILIPTAYFMLLGALTELGRIVDLDEALSPSGQILRLHPELDRSRYASWFRCVRATLDARISAAEAFAEEGYVRSRAVADPDGESVRIGQFAVIRWMQDRVSELEPMLLQARHMLPGDFIWSATLAWLWLSEGRKSAARGLVSMMPRPTEVPKDRNWLAALSILGVVAAGLEERELARQLVGLLEPFSDRLASIGLGVTVWGTVARPLAMLHGLLGNQAESEKYYREAIRICTAAGAHAWLAEAQLELAELLAVAQHPSSRAEVAGLLDEVGAAARALQLNEIDARVVRLATELGVTTDAQREPGLSGLNLQGPEIRILGGFEVIALDRSAANWQSRKARELLKILVAKRGAVVLKETLLDLLWPGERPEKLRNRLAVALMTVRRALDPQQSMHRNTFLVVTRDTVQLRVDRCSVDIEVWFTDADEALCAQEPGRADTLSELLRRANAVAFADEADAVWADRIRRELHSRAFAVADALIEEAERAGDHLACVDTYRWILEVDPFDQRAHLGLIQSYQALAAHGRANGARAEYVRRMAELGIAGDAVGRDAPRLSDPLNDRGEIGLGDEVFDA